MMNKKIPDKMNCRETQQLNLCQNENSSFTNIADFITKKLLSSN